MNDWINNFFTTLIILVVSLHATLARFGLIISNLNLVLGNFVSSMLQEQAIVSSEKSFTSSDESN